jgi:hypothetical protein
MLLHKGDGRANPVFSPDTRAKLSSALAQSCVGGGLPQRLGEALPAESLLGNGRWANPKLCQAPAPEGLVAKEGHHHGWDTGA